MTTEELEQMTEEMLTDAVGELLLTRSVHMHLRIAFDDGRPPVQFDPPPQIANAPHAKSLLFALVSKFARTQRAAAVFLVTDAVTVRYTPEQEEHFKNKNTEYLNALLSCDSVEEVAKRGLGILQETVIVTAETPGSSFVKQKWYRREADGKIVLEDVPAGQQGQYAKAVGRMVFFGESEGPFSRSHTVEGNEKDGIQAEGSKADEALTDEGARQADGQAS